MDVKKISELVSQATWDEPTLLFHSPEEVEKDIADGRAITLQNNGEFVGFCSWKDIGGGLELSTVYVAPKFRGQGRSLEIIGLAAEQLKLLTQYKYAFLFTQVPAMKKVVTERYNFKAEKFYKLPPKVWVHLIAHWLNPYRILSYVKYFKAPHRIGASRLYIVRLS